MNWKSLDWKYIATFIVAVASVFVPSLWQSTQDARSISVKLLASTTLQPRLISGIPDLEVLLNGQKLDNPYLSLLELVNDGNKPISTADFDSPIELLSGSGVSVKSAQVSGSSPPDIAAKISVTDGKVVIAPFLSNVSDSIFFTVITAGGQPTFAVRARIAGIKQVGITDTSTPESHTLKSAFSIGMSFFMAVMYFVMMQGVNNGLITSKWLGYLASVGLAAGCSYALANAQAEILEYLPTRWGSLFALTVMMTLANFVARPVLRLAGFKP